MPVPFEGLIPYGIMITMFCITGAGLGAVKIWQNNGKTPRWSVDNWDRQMMARDMRLTGEWRGQTDKPVAPAGFELSNAWPVERRME